MDIPVLIPSYNPDRRLPEVVDALIREGVKRIIIVNDGSRPECDSIFEKLGKLESCTVLKHAVNCGKGRALKTGLNYFLLHFPGSPGIVTADGDGQHQTTDILKVINNLKENPDKLIIGARELGGKVPFRSLFGNVLTRFVFSIVIGKKISDTQSGLRGLPRSLVPQLLKVTGERYEYEINMLILSKRQSVDIIETPIDTIYLENNVSSHFNPFFDSMKIYFQLLRFAFSSMLASFCDFIVFSIAYNLTANIMVSLLIGRFLIGSLLNYIINRRLVFHSKTRVLSSLFKYYLALIVMSVLSYLLITLALAHLGFKVMIAKVVVETLLFVFSFAIQREFVFFSETEDSLGSSS
ncbi:MAG: bifunctional glycosyltransferase family 2/GtrA family protein [Candidatus Aminicenantes bacterium]|nr:MAG: bifunctional glycosyltransferase family 2/GtrA family protein [Candidatus Aminicenantes bacterium]